MRLILSAALLATCTLLTASPSRAAESYDNCAGTITSLPAVITTQGVWCLKSDLATAISNGTAITVATNNVTIDCNDFKLGNLAAGPTTTTYGISITSRANAVVRNCNLRGFYTGIYTIDGFGHVIEDNRVDGSHEVGITVYSPNSSVRRNLVIDTGDRFIGTSTSMAITVAYGADVIDNTIKGVEPPQDGGDVMGIYSLINAGGTISGNRISGVAAGAEDSGWGIRDQSTDTLIDNNYLIGFSSGVSTGIQCDQPSATASRNVLVGFSSNLSGCYQIDNLPNPN